MRWAMKMAAKAGRHWGGGFGGPFGPFGPNGPFGPGGPFGPSGPFGGRGGRGGPRHGRRRMFDRAELRLVLLKLIAEQPRHGYDLIKAMEELSGGQYSPSPGVVYPALAMLADEGLIAERESEDQRRQFAITPAGEAVLAEEAGAVAEAYERLIELAENAERGREPSIERASVNLFTALSQRMRAGDEGGDDLAHRIAEILDEAAQKIERL
jgi:DNA-binding PadR family transcriptional regulator